MFSETNLRELLEFTSPHPVLSVYLNTEPSEGNADAYKLRLRNMLKSVNLPKDVAAVERYFDREYDWSGRSVAVFSCAGENFFRAYPLALAVRDFIFVGDRPSVKVLADLMDNYGGYGVALVDKQGARLFFFHLGELREQEGVLGELVKHTKRGGASTVPGRRGGIAGRTQYQDELVERNMKEAVDFAVRFFEENHVRRVLIGGSDDNVAQFRSLLPKAWQSLVKGTFAIGMTASHAEVLARTMQIGSEAERQREASLVENLITTALKKGNAVIGAEDTLKVVSEGRAQTLVVSEGFHLEGYRCTNCQNLTLSGNSNHCTVCGAALEAVPDVVELAVGETMRRGGEVEVVRSHPSFEKHGGMGAYLRY